MIKRNIQHATYVFISLVLMSSLALGQESLQLGNLSYSRSPAPVLTKPVTRGASFFRAVGGVAFEGVAVGKDGLVVENLTYDKTKPDSQRLIVTVKTSSGKIKNLQADIYDWELVPITKFANYKTGSAMTLFGHLNDRKLQDELQRNGGRAINYHRTLDNTLIGLRMMQADIMLFDHNATDLPKNLGGSYVLGAGEREPKVEKNRRNFNIVQQLLREERQKGNRYRSYVVGDLNQTIVFSDRNGHLSFKGDPFWTMWSYPSDVEAAYEDLQLFQAAREGDSVSLSLLNSRYVSEEELVRRFREIDNILSQWESQSESNEAIQINSGLSQRVSDIVAEQGGINPVVYNALKKVMHYRALFRHFKKRNKTRFLTFLNSVRNISVNPKVQTPTVQRTVSLH